MIYQLDVLLCLEFSSPDTFPLTFESSRDQGADITHFDGTLLDGPHPHYFTFHQDQKIWAQDVFFYQK